MISARLRAVVRCPDCRGALSGQPPALVCTFCGRDYAGGDFLDLRPSRVYGEQTKYLDEALHADARHETVSPPLLSAAIRNDMLRAFLEPQPNDVVIDLGCGSGRTLVWNRDLGAWQVGLDVSPFFASEARATIDLTLGDLRQLPFADGTFNKAYSLDVLEHLSRDALAAMLRETARVLTPGGTLFVYSHVRKNSSLAVGLRLINRLARALERAHAIDLSRERLRKSDHRNPVDDIPDLEKLVAGAGFRIARIRFYTPLVGGFIENIVMRLGERALGRWIDGPPRGSASPTSRADTNLAAQAKAARLDVKRRLSRHGPTYAALRVLTWLMKLDVWCFGRVPSGPFFALLRKTGPASPPVADAR